MFFRNYAKGSTVVRSDSYFEGEREKCDYKKEEGERLVVVSMKKVLIKKQKMKKVKGKPCDGFAGVACEKQKIGSKRLPTRP